MACCPERSTVAILPIANCGTCFPSAATSTARTEAGVGFVVDVLDEICTRFSLSVKLATPPPTCLAQPSGIDTEKCAPTGVNGTNAWLSGMSPGGLDSVATGAAAELATDAEWEVTVAVVFAGVVAAAPSCRPGAFEGFADDAIGRIDDTAAVEPDPWDVTDVEVADIGSLAPASGLCADGVEHPTSRTAATAVAVVTQILRLLRGAPVRGLIASTVRMVR